MRISETSFTSRVFDMTDAAAWRAVIEDEKPDLNEGERELLANSQAAAGRGTSLTESGPAALIPASA